MQWRDMTERYPRRCGFGNISISLNGSLPLPPRYKSLNFSQNWMPSDSNSDINQLHQYLYDSPFAKTISILGFGAGPHRHGNSYTLDASTLRRAPCVWHIRGRYGFRLRSKLHDLIPSRKVQSKSGESTRYLLRGQTEQREQNRADLALSFCKWL
jgi:hypothetical protein